MVSHNDIAGMARKVGAILGFRVFARPVDYAAMWRFEVRNDTLPCGCIRAPYMEMLEKIAATDPQVFQTEILMHFACPHLEPHFETPDILITEGPVSVVPEFWTRSIFRIPLDVEALRLADSSSCYRQVMPMPMMEMPRITMPMPPPKITVETNERAKERLAKFIGTLK